MAKKNPHATALGRRGGKVKSVAKAEAARRNWKKAMEVIKGRANGASEK